MDERLALLTQGRRLRGSHGMVVDLLGRAIVSGRFPEGSLLPRDEEMVEELDVSRTVLREAQKTLAAKGMIVARTRVGTTVRPVKDWNMFDADVLAWHFESQPSPAFFAQVIEMRLAFEPFAAELAANRASNGEVAAMRAQVEAMRTAPDKLHFVRADMEFHRIILTAAQNSFLNTVGALIDTALFILMDMSSPADDPTKQKRSAGMHGHIAEAIARGDGPAAAAAMRDVIHDGQLRLNAAEAAAARVQ